MRRPWQRRSEPRSSTGSYQQDVLRAIKAEAAGMAAEVGAAAVVEAAGALSRAFASATVSKA